MNTSSIVGHEQAKRFFSKALERGFSSHAYLLSGPEGIGKRTVALEVIRSAHPETEPGVTDPYAFVVEPDEKGTISIEEHIRPLKRVLSLRPPEGVRTFVLIDDADRLSFDASHALLKMLEEPPASAVFLLVTSAPGLLPETIRSRCHQVRCMAPTMEQVEAFLRSYGVSERDLPILAALAGGSVGWLSSTLGQGGIQETILRAKELAERMGRSAAERLVWAKELAGRPALRTEVLHWLHAVRSELVRSPKRAMLARGLLKLHQVLGRSNRNVRLAVEHFVLTSAT